MEKTNNGLVEYARHFIGCPYWFGTYGQIGTYDLYKQKKGVYPANYKANDFTSQFGKVVHDCSGLIKGYLMKDDVNSIPVYKSSMDLSAAWFYARANEKGSIDLFPKTHGMLVFKGQYPSAIYHIGVYDATKNTVIHAKGHAWGVVEEPFKKSDWTFWAQCHFIKKESDKKYVNDVSGFPEIRKGSKGIYVTLLQQALNLYKITVDIDGDFGPKTEYAVKEFQARYGLVKTGVVNYSTWRKMFA